MNPSTIATLLQLIAAMLTGAQHNVAMSPSTTEQTIAIASQAVQLSVQAEKMPSIGFSIPPDNSIWPNITDLYNSAYLDANGNYQPLGTGVALVGEDTSFGDLNGDGLDDAAVVVQSTNSYGKTIFRLVAMLNQGGILFNIADLTLGTTVQVFSHHVVQGGDVVLNMQVDGQPAATSTYYLLGDQWMEE